MSRMCLKIIKTGHLIFTLCSLPNKNYEGPFFRFFGSESGTWPAFCEGRKAHLGLLKRYANVIAPLEKTKSSVRTPNLVFLMPEAKTHWKTHEA